MKSADIRQTFLDFFAKKGHQIVNSSSLVPHGDPTLLFTNAGMNQFKDVFLGTDKRIYQRATSSQKCVRAGGKHNDLENVGFTARHHTFFEMLGNFSFGDYFKTEAICYAWELLTEVFKLPKDRLWITIYAEDDEAFEIWTKKAGVPSERVIRIGDNKGSRYASDNFWMMGEIGPCGPCTEIFYDHGADIPGGLPGTADEDGDRYIEIWNNVFMQFNRDENGVMHPLPKPSVDTGMGVERMAAVLQSVHNNYQTDLFIPLIQAAARETNCQDIESASLKVLADHIRACSFLIADGVIPGNEGRGFVLRRIIRRAVRHGYKLGARQAFFYRLVSDLVKQMGDAYPELKLQQNKIENILNDEETRFFATIDNGMNLLNSELSKLNGGKIFSGETAFKLHDTFGFPLDLTSSICREQEIEVNETEFAKAMANQREQARRAGKFKMLPNLAYSGVDTEFVGYQQLQTDDCKIIALYRADTPVEQLQESEEGVVVIDLSPFYAESGGQVGDSGELIASDGLFSVKDTQKIKAQVWGHIGIVSTGVIKVGDKVKAKVASEIRQQTANNHSATHLLHLALRTVLGKHVEQKGSQVDDSKTRFDFVHPKPLSNQEIIEVENLVNQQIWQNSPTKTQLMSLENAQKSGAMMLFGEKYGDEVRVISIGNSVELCGGTHVTNSGDIGTFKIISESGISAGVRRIEAICGKHTLELLQKQSQQLENLAKQLKTPIEEINERLEQTITHNHQLEKELQQLKRKLLSLNSEQLLANVVEVNGIKLLTSQIDDADLDQLRDLADQLRDKLSSGLVVLASTNKQKVSLVATLSKDLTKKYSAGKVINFVAEQVGGKGGGRPDMATAGGNQPENLANALQSVKEWLQKQI